MLAGNVSLRFFILGLLTRQPMSGYDIKRFVRSLSWLIGGVSSGGLYPALRALLEDGLATVNVKLRERRPPRKIYTITDAGRRELRQWVDGPTGPDRSMRAFIMRLILASNYSRDGLIARMEQRRLQAAVQGLELDQAIVELGDSADLGQRLALDYALSVARAELAWLDRELGRVSQEASLVEVG
jgi:PadR family transcriptional regulator AphA